MLVTMREISQLHHIRPLNRTRKGPTNHISIGGKKRAFSFIYILQLRRVGNGVSGLHDNLMFLWYQMKPAG